MFRRRWKRLRRAVLYALSVFVTLLGIAVAVLLRLYEFVDAVSGFFVSWPFSYFTACLWQAAQRETARDEAAQTAAAQQPTAAEAHSLREARRELEAMARGEAYTWQPFHEETAREEESRQPPALRECGSVKERR